METDIADVLRSLSIRHRRIARLLQKNSPAEVANKLHVHRSTIYAPFEICVSFWKKGDLGAYCPSAATKGSTPDTSSVDESSRIF